MVTGLKELDAIAENGVDDSMLPSETARRSFCTQNLRSCRNAFWKTQPRGELLDPEADIARERLCRRRPAAPLTGQPALSLFESRA